jgi:ABC-type oligopeptide transport system ATPase subunit
MADEPVRWWIAMVNIGFIVEGDTEKIVFADQTHHNTRYLLQSKPLRHGF